MLRASAHHRKRIKNKVPQPLPFCPMTFHTYSATSNNDWKLAFEKVHDEARHEFLMIPENHENADAKWKEVTKAHTYTRNPDGGTSTWLNPSGTIQNYPHMPVGAWNLYFLEIKFGSRIVMYRIALLFPSFTGKLCYETAFHNGVMYRFM